MDDKHTGKGAQKAQAQQRAPGQQRKAQGSKLGKKEFQRSRETLHHGRLPEGNGATGKPAYFPPHP